MATATDLHVRGVAALNARRFAAAASLLARAAEQAIAEGDVDIEARVSASTAFLDYETGAVEAAFAGIDRALSLSGIGAETRGVVLCQRAMLLLRRGETSEALAAFGDGIGSLSDPVELGKAHINRGGVHLAQGKATDAAADFERARALWTAADRTDDAAIAAHNLGYACFLTGDLVRALSYMNEGAGILRGMSPVMAATVDQDRAEVLLAAGLVSEGRAALTTAARAFGRRRLNQRRAEAELVLAKTLAISDPRSALTAAQSASRRFARAGASSWRARADGIALAAASRLDLNHARLLGRAGEVEQELVSQGLDSAAQSVRLSAALAELRGGRVGEARERIRKRPPKRDTPLDVRLLDREVRAELAAATGRRPDALRHLRLGLLDLHEWQSSFGSLDLQTNVVGHGIRLGLRGLEIALSARSDPLVFEWSERGRMLASRVQPVRPPADEELAAGLKRLRSETDPEQEAQLRQRIRERAWQRQGSGEVADPVSLTELQSGLGDARALIAYVVAAGRVVALAVTSAGAVRVDLGAREPLDTLLGGLLPDLDVAATDLPGPLATAVRGDLVSRLGRLADLLVAPLLDALGDRSAVLTPSGVLAGVPWTLLPGLAGRPVTVAQSATSWLARRATPLRTRSAGFVAGPRVARAEAEVKAGAKEWDGSTVLTGRDATADAVSALAASVDVLHVAAHGRHSAESPLFSGLQLVDGPWFGYDIDQLAGVPDVVLLSACEVGRSTVRWGEELIGMTAAWLHAGARCVIASPAAVADAAAYDAFVGVHRGLAAGLEPAEALAAAVGTPEVEAPPAPFVCFS